MPSSEEPLFPATTPPMAQIRLGHQGSPDAVELRITDSRFRTVATGFGCIDTTLTPGIYEVERRAGSKFERKMVRLKPGQVYVDNVVKVEFETPMPLMDTTSSRESYRGALNHLSNIRPDNPSKNSGLVVFVRNLERDSGLEVSRQLFHGWHFRNSHGEEIDLLPYLEVNESQEWLGLGVALPPGGYTVEVPQSEATYCQSIWLANGWTTGVFIPNTRDGLALDNATVQMISFGMPWPFDDEEIHGVNRTAELALAALKDGRTLLRGPALQQLLSHKFQNPFLGIVAALALLFDQTPDQTLLEEVAGNLVSLVPDHPDVQAILFACHQRLPNTQLPKPSPVAFPPLLQAAFRWLLTVEAEGVDAIANDSFAERIAALRVLRGPWTTWKLEAPTSRIINAKKAAMKIWKEHSPKLLSTGSAGVYALPGKSILSDFRGYFAGILDKILKNSSPLLVASSDFNLPEFLAILDLDNPTVAKIVTYLHDLYQDSGSQSLKEFIDNLDPSYISRNLGLPLHPVTLFVDKLREAAQEKAGKQV